MMSTAHCNVQKSGAPVLFVLLLFLIWSVDVQGEERYANLASGTITTQIQNAPTIQSTVDCYVVCCNCIANDSL
jgi:hypothetical protein